MYSIAWASRHPERRRFFEDRLSVTRAGRLVLLGHPVSRSLSAVLQNAALKAAGIPVAYEALDVEPAKLADTLRELRAQNIAGNVTIPHKSSVAGRCSVLTPVAAEAGAVNTFWFAPDGHLHGDNTDVAAFEIAITQLLTARPTRLRFLVYGAGGGAAAVLTALRRFDGCTALVFGRNQERVNRLCERFSDVATPGADGENAIVTANVLVNATPIGMHAAAFPLELRSLHKGCAVIDLAYSTGETPLVRTARANGHRAADGRTMLLEQGILAFERWFGFTPDREAMWSALETALSGPVRSTSATQLRQ